MINIRRGLFETNSSSMHSIAITKNDEIITREELLDSVFIDKNNKLKLYDVEYGYGREFDVLYSFIDKLQYALCYYCGKYYGDELEFVDNYNMILGIVKEILPEVNDFIIRKKELDLYLDRNGNPILHKNLVREYNGETKEFLYKYIDKNDGKEYDAVLDTKFIIECPDIGTIDHQSYELLGNFLNTNNITLKDFLINKKYVIITDSDEIQMVDKLLNSKTFILNIEGQLYKV